MCLLSCLIPIAILIDEILYSLGVSGSYMYHPIPILVLIVAIVVGIVLEVITVYFQVLRCKK
jgi:hypothetical protein